MLFTSADYIKMISGPPLTMEVNIINPIKLQLMPRTQTVDASFPNVKMQFCCNGLTLSERKISTSTSPLETNIIFNKMASP